MLISVEKRFVFVANTKTASTSIEHAFMPHSDIFRGGTPARKHLPLSKIIDTYDFLFGQPEQHPDTYFKFGVMRHPIEWISSWYRFRKGNDVESPLPRDMSFAEFWEQKDWNFISQEGVPNLQRKMFCAEDGTILADVIIPYYLLNQTLEKICNGLGIQASLTRKNVSNMKPHQVLPGELREVLLDFYQKDIELFESLAEHNAVGMEKFWRMQKK